MTDLQAIPDPSSLQALLAELPANLLAGRRVLVTGGARGLGLAFAQCIAAAGAHVVLADILGELAQAEARALRDAGHAAHALAVDLSDPAAIDAARAKPSACSAGSTASSTTPPSPTRAAATRTSSTSTPGTA